LGNLAGWKWEIDSMAADQQLKESLKELHDLKAARNQLAIFHLSCPDALLFRKTHNPKEDS
jgi:hypothetical protein